ncbi:hypothetical protein GGI03_003851 [Coemansia sp. RSA 2337]|nr:hypothetical protein GGI08_008150 [Coemansia sp. S2]KAJ2049796.1 hypothetical protein H4S04_003007 [Coemansia sp. S16]KAJ2115540.1 hypothetical protein IW146_002226 [Coemansia sp. RSA 922]KAJ2463425.1 hypothetical protein GGI03_003851 [Coemansia sp. RSA 2337]
MKFTLSSFAVLSIAAAIAHAADPTLHIFGDSLSDIGTLETLTLGLVPSDNHWNGRFSSGPVWNEYLAKLLKFNLYNRAIGGSTSDNDHSTLIDVLNINIPSTENQIDFFGFTHPLYYFDGTRSKDIAILEVGANDFFADKAAIKSGNLTITHFVDRLANTVVEQLEDLRKIGFKNIVLTNLAAIQHSPMANAEGIVDMTTKVVTQYNQKIASQASAWAAKASGVSSFMISDLGSFVELTIKSPAIIAALGLTDIKTPCLGAGSTNYSLETLIASAMGKETSTGMCSSPSTMYFFDDVHPAERVHRLFGYYSFATIAAKANNTIFELNEANILSLISKYNLGTPSPKPAAV